MTFSLFGRRRAALLLSISTLNMVGLTGCMMGAHGSDQPVGTVTYLHSVLTATLGSPIADVDRATKKAVTDLQFVNFGEKHDGLTAIYECQTAQETNLKIQISRLTDTTTKVEIRVELLGNERLSRAVLEKIQAQL